MDEKRVYYKSEKISVSFAPSVCIHAAECIKGLPNVFDTSKKPWVNVAGANPEEIIEVIDMCPSGALKYELIDYELELEKKKMEKTKITVMPNGPLMIEGNLTVNKMSGENIKDGEKLFLCRCGHSANKPFCDGSHKKEDFKAE
ncbi:MAG: (4Fe-4S)-binding protein [Ignavibacteriae bacterium]|nr:(4Fe-4S)-binding protein [Ignavibacteriota bacterium]MCB9259056.1 (4Fe-4S)-binding protein [Ignavibacteriales bacterium]